MEKLKFIHVNQHVIRSNLKNGQNEPVFTIKVGRSGKAIKAFSVSTERQCLFNYGGNEKVFDRKKVMAEFRKNKCLVVNDNTGYDEFYLLAGDDMKVTDGQMATPSDNAKKGEIKRLFTQNLKSNRSSRIVMNKFITQVA